MTPRPRTAAGPNLGGIVFRLREAMSYDVAVTVRTRRGAEITGKVERVFRDPDDRRHEKDLQDKTASNLIAVIDGHQVRVEHIDAGTLVRGQTTRED